MAVVIGNNLKDAVNLTPHAIVIVDDDGKVIMNIQPSGKTARLIQTEREMAKVLVGDGVYASVVLASSSGHDHYSMCDFNGAEGEKNIIVSKMVADYIWKTMDSDTTLWVPNTGPDSVVRDSAGGIIGVKSMLLYTKPT